MMKDFFKVADLDQVLGYARGFDPVDTEDIPISDAHGRILAQNFSAAEDLPGFNRSTMDGYAVCATSTFGVSEANPGYFTIKGSVIMGQTPEMSVDVGEAVKISTGGMLPRGADSVVMVEHTSILDDTTIEVYRSVAPAQNVMAADEDFQKGELILPAGHRLRAQDLGLLAAFGRQSVVVFRQPIIGIISTGDEVVPIDTLPGPGRIRDVNSHTLAGFVQAAGGISKAYGIVKDDYQLLFDTCAAAADHCDMVLISGGSSVGMRDFTMDVLAALPQANIMVHGISISPGKPTILANVANKAVWGLPGQVTSAMVVFFVVVRPFLDRIAGRSGPLESGLRIPARLSRNVASAQGRVDYVRVRLTYKGEALWAEPILGKSGLLNTMVRARGLVEIGVNAEGLEKGDKVQVMLFSASDIGR
jgi:molybdopterin molybdotransferase